MENVFQFIYFFFIARWDNKRNSLKPTYIEMAQVRAALSCTDIFRCSFFQWSICSSYWWYELYTFFFYNLPIWCKMFPSPFFSGTTNWINFAMQYVKIVRLITFLQLQWNLFWRFDYWADINCNGECFAIYLLLLHSTFG